MRNFAPAFYVYWIQGNEGMIHVKRIYVNLTDDEAAELKERAEYHSATPGELLAAFTADLTCSKRSGGSDERMYANDWLGRQCCRWSGGKMIT